MSLNVKNGVSKEKITSVAQFSCLKIAPRKKIQCCKEATKFFMKIIMNTR